MDSAIGFTPATPSPDGLVHAGVWPVDESLSSRWSATHDLESLLSQITEVDGAGCTDASRVDQLALLERVKGAAAAAQARISVEFERSQLAAQDAARVPARRRGRGIGDQIALARGASAGQGPRHLGFAKAVVKEMVHTHSLLTNGQISEWVATLLVRETAVLTLEDRQRVDEDLCAMRIDTVTGEIHPPRVLELVTPRKIEAAARALAVQLDPEAVVRRAGKAAKDRRVWTRPSPDTMAVVSGLVPVAQGVACWASLDAAARAIKASGDERSIDQIRADLFVERLTGQTTADAVPIAVGLIIDGPSLAGESERPAATGDGTVVPAQTARDLIDSAIATGAGATIRDVHVDPDTGGVTDVGKQQRFHRGLDAVYLNYRDRTCRHPGCDAPIRHKDHPKPVAAGGRTTRANSQGLCEHHNYVKEMPGWTARVVDARPGRHTIEVTTPTGHRYFSKAPPGLPPPV